MKKFKLYPNEHIDEQKEKHEAYTKAGFKLARQYQKNNGIVIRKYEKDSSAQNQ